MSKSIDEVLIERGSRYGTFLQNASAAQTLKSVMRNANNWNHLNFDQREALDMIAAKIGRILTGDPNYADSWRDIAGYAKLVENRLNSPVRPSIETDFGAAGSR